MYTSNPSCISHTYGVLDPIAIGSGLMSNRLFLKTPILNVLSRLVMKMGQCRPPRLAHTTENDVTLIIISQKYPLIGSYSILCDTATSNFL